MIKTFIVIGILVGVIASFLTPDIVNIILSIKGSIIYYLSPVLSRLSITAINFEILYVVVTGILKKL